MSKHDDKKHHHDAEAALSSKHYGRELEALDLELIHLQQWAQKTGARIVVIFEGRDAAGKGGVIKRIAEPLNPRFVVLLLWVCRQRKKNHNGIFSVMLRIFLPLVKSFSLIARGIIAPVLKRLWAFAQAMNMKPF